MCLLTLLPPSLLSLCHYLSLDVYLLSSTLSLHFSLAFPLLIIRRFTVLKHSVLCQGKWLKLSSRTTFISFSSMFSIVTTKLISLSPSLCLRPPQTMKMLTQLSKIEIVS